jgi:hypothetical protein
MKNLAALVWHNTAGIDDGLVAGDVDDTVIEVHGYAKQGAGFGYTGGARTQRAVGHRHNRAGRTGGLWHSGCARVVQLGPRGAAAGPRVRPLRGRDATSRVLLRANSAFYGHATVGSAVKAGAQVWVTPRMDPKVKAAIASVPPEAWTPIEYRPAVYDPESGRWISRAEAAEIPFTAFGSRKRAEQVTGRLVVRRIPDLNPSANPDQAALFLWRFHAFFTTSDLDTTTADKTDRGRAIIEQVNADLNNSALAQLPLATFAANSAWLALAVMAFNLTRAVAAAGPRLDRTVTGTIRRTLIAVPARIASSARRLTLHLPSGWPRQPAWTTLFIQTCGP